MLLPLADQIRFVLVGSESPGNIGAAARALKTMGLRQLWLVQPACDPTAEEAHRLAHNATDVLTGAVQVETLAEALSDTCFSVATTQRARRHGLLPLSPPAAATELIARSAVAPVALVFGRESAGLTNPEVALCTTASTVPAATLLPALNLAQAVMIYAYEVFQAAERQASAQAVTPSAGTLQWATSSDTERLLAHVQTTLTAVGARPAVSWPRWLDKFRRTFQRMSLETRDVLLLHKLLEAVDRFVQRRQ